METEAAKLIHVAFTEEIGSEPNYRVHERAYHDYIAAGYTVADLRMVIQYLKAENKRMNGARHSLRLDRLLDFEYRRFDSLLNCAKAAHRNRVPKPTQKEVVLEQFRGITPEPKGNCRPIADVFEAMRKASS